MRPKPSSDILLTERHALFLDFDGTLAPICDDPDSVTLSDMQTDLLVSLSEHLSSAVAIISGRDLRDLSTRVPAALWRSGNHGLYVAPPHKIVPTDLPALPSGLLTSLERFISHMEGVWVEKKGPVAAIHFRAAPQYEDDILNSVETILKRFSGYKIQHGNKIIEAKPLAANKGYFIQNQMTRRSFSGRIPVMIGDDTTDEDAFQAVQNMGGIAVKVGDGESCANYRAPEISDVYLLLRSAL
ncbi:trehalose-phosphatase [Hellea balneolensis]|uniref:trehalose-phosphatase n=1 Tax=Hellea balneolensis TaxID=287478 RepID=UPI0006873035|nr:trehalose-phosphatase [Hellea balneolensis]